MVDGAVKSKTAVSRSICVTRPAALAPSASSRRWAAASSNWRVRCCCASTADSAFCCALSFSRSSSSLSKSIDEICTGPLAAAGSAAAAAGAGAGAASGMPLLAALLARKCEYSSVCVIRKLSLRCCRRASRISSSCFCRSSSSFSAFLRASFSSRSLRRQNVMLSFTRRLHLSCWSRRRRCGSVATRRTSRWQSCASRCEFCARVWLKSEKMRCILGISRVAICFQRRLRRSAGSLGRRSTIASIASASAFQPGGRMSRTRCSASFVRPFAAMYCTTGASRSSCVARARRARLRSCSVRRCCARSLAWRCSRARSCCSTRC
eukprot:Unigene8739_Nuclearia_a/m.26762 Unigene8739_Nuclearia_a/g.26762  ORF Unigene8739_Nuclearia_a/g.26762 Unigene8739_Nuclearia_a/m.26762 type:complete len:322 (-) Unigene8739_Nuclearia_a:357-1322(-)